jgi:hypothetical protein
MIGLRWSFLGVLFFSGVLAISVNLRDSSELSKLFTNAVIQKSGSPYAGGISEELTVSLPYEIALSGSLESKPFPDKWGVAVGAKKRPEQFSTADNYMSKNWSWLKAADPTAYDAIKNDVTQLLARKEWVTPLYVMVFAPVMTPIGAHLTGIRVVGVKVVFPVGFQLSYFGLTGGYQAPSYRLKLNLSWDQKTTAALPPKGSNFYYKIVRITDPFICWSSIYNGIEEKMEAQWSYSKTKESFVIEIQ